MKKNTLEDFIKKSQQIHNNKYDYSKVKYINNRTKVCIICPIHGEFWQTPHSHLSGCGCCKCKNDKSRQRLLLTTENFINKAIQIHGDKYNYSKVNYIGTEDKVCIICPEHGEFWQTPSGHLSGYGCTKCYNERRGANLRDDLTTFISKAQQIYGNKYNYSKVKYINSRTEICIICPEHGEFWQTPNKHLHTKYGCPLCRKEEQVKNKEKKHFILKNKKQNNEKRKYNNKFLTQEAFIKDCILVHENKYDYSKVEYVNNHTKVCIICPEHGEFWQTPANHKKGHGCPMCARRNMAVKCRFDKETFIENARKIHGDKYDYSKVEYINNNTKVHIICPKHGEFCQTPAMHYNEKQGCPECGCLSSKGENEVLSFIKENYDEEIIHRDKSIIHPKELDIVIPKHNIAIEFNGLRWHSEQFDKDKYYHLSKTLYCSQKNIKLIQIFEDEWLYKKDIVKNKLLHILKLDVNKQKIYARKCNVTYIDNQVAKNFIEKYHIQGFTVASVYIGCYFNDNLVGVMTFLRTKGNSWILNRFCTNHNVICCGIGGKLFKFFVKEYNPDCIVSFADRRWCVNENDNLYIKIGFHLSQIMPPDYRYVSSKTSYRIRYHKFNFRKQLILKRFPNSGITENMTEKEMTEKLGYYRVWDCGLIKYEWHPSNI